MKRHILSAVLLLLGTFFASVCIAEVSFPESFLTITDYEFLIEKLPKIWKYNLHVGIAALVLAILAGFFAYKKDKDFTVKGLETLLRIGIGLFFISSSLFKIQDPKGFAVLVAQYQFLPDFINNLFSLIYPQFEFWFGLALIVTPFAKESALAIFWMFVSFIIALSWALALDLGITCGCFEIEGAQSKSETWTALIRDLILIGPTFWLTLRPNRSLVGIWRAKN